MTKVNHNEKIKSLYASKNCIHVLKTNNPLEPPIQWIQEYTHTIEEAYDIISVSSYAEFDNTESVYRTLIAVTYIGKTINEEGNEILKDNDFHLDIYGIHSSYTESFSDIFSDRTQFSLSSVPFILTNFDIQFLQQRCFFLSLADNSLHIYGRDQNGEFCEMINAHSYVLPQTFSSTVTSIDVFNLDQYSQAFVYGQQNGTITLLIFNHQDRSKKIFSTVLDGPISFVRFYQNLQFKNPPTHPYFQDLSDKLSFFNNQNSYYKQESFVHIIVGGAIGYALLFKNVFEEGLNDSSTLPESDKYDSILCCSIIYNVLTGRNTILIGTYGKKILAYEEKSYLLERSKKTETQTEENIIQSSEIEYKSPLDDNNKEANSLNGSSMESGSDVFHKIKKIRNEEDMKYILGNTSTGSTPEEPSIYLSNVSPERLTKSKSTNQTKPFNERSSFTSKSSFTLSWSFSLCDPVYGIIHGDFLNDGVDSFIVTTSFGIHLFQVNQVWLKEKIKKKLNIIKSIREKLAKINEKGSNNDEESPAYVINEGIKEGESDYEKSFNIDLE